MNKKLLFGLGSTLVISIPALSVVSCGNTSSSISSIKFEEITVDNVQKMRATISGDNLPTDPALWVIEESNSTKTFSSNSTHRDSDLWTYNKESSTNKIAVFEANSKDVKDKVFTFGIKDGATSRPVVVKPATPSTDPVINNKSVSLDETGKKVELTISGSNLPTTLDKYNIVKSLSSSGSKDDEQNIWNMKTGATSTNVVFEANYENVYGNTYEINVEESSKGTFEVPKSDITNVTPGITESKDLTLTVSGTNLSTISSLYVIESSDSSTTTEKIDPSKYTIEYISSSRESKSVLITIKTNDAEDYYGKDYQISGSDSSKLPIKFTFKIKQEKPNNTPEFTEEQITSGAWNNNESSIEISGQHLPGDQDSYTLTKVDGSSVESGWKISGNGGDSITITFENSIEAGNYTLTVGQNSITIVVPAKDPISNTPSFDQNQSNLKLTKIGVNQKQSESKKWKVNIRGINLPRAKEGSSVNYSIIDPENSEIFIHNNGGSWSITKNRDGSISLFTSLESPEPGTYKLRIRNTNPLQEVTFIVDNTPSSTLRESTSLIDKVVKNNF
ncbi:MAG: hypothetical protein HDR43_00560 [Mycoplasma sp.]|nr:hypothetical protein [Mycoplasma sp.]